MASLIALTGGTGFVGGAVLRALLDRGMRVRALSRREGAIPNDRGIEIFQGDLAGESGFEGFLEGADAVVHIAGLIKARSREEFDRVNVEGTRRLMEAAMRRKRPPRFLYMSSLAAREPHVSDYAASKRAGERVKRSIRAGVRPAASPSAISRLLAARISSWLTRSSSFCFMRLKRKSRLSC